MTLPSVLTALLKTSVMVNGLLVPGRQAANSLQRFCRPVCFFNDGSVYEISWAGSCFLFKYRSHHLAFFTKHQLVNAHNARQPSEFCIIVGDRAGDGKIAITPNQAASLTHDRRDYGFAEDIQFVEYEAQRGDRDLASFFADIDFDALPDLRPVPKQQLVAVFSLGYPSDFASYHFDLDDDAVPQNAQVTHRWGKLVLANDWEEGDMEFHLTLRQHEKYPETIKDFDGFSGSPVFFFYKDAHSQVRLGFAGMIRLSGNGIVHVYEAAHMKKILDRGFPKPSGG
jgi:hypothetical protein